MRLIYLTSKRYSSTTADHFFVRSMAEAFTKILGENFSFVVRGKSCEELKDVNTNYVNAPSRGRLLFYFFWIPIFVLKNKVGKETVFFSNDPNLLSILIFWKKIFKFKYLICSDWHQLFHDFRDKYISKNSDYLITTSENLKKLILHVSGINPNKILVAYGGVNLNMFEGKTESKEVLRRSLGLPESDILIGYVGFYKTMGMSKGVDIMINALHNLQNKSIKMVFVGGRGKDIDEYKDIAINLGLSDRAIFIPAVPNESIVAWQKAMDALVIPYPNKPHFRDYGFPMKVYEYMTSERPVIYSNLPIISEILSDCATSFNPDDSLDLAQKIADIVNEESPAIELALKAKEKVQNYTWERRANRIIDFIKN